MCFDLTHAPVATAARAAATGLVSMSTRPDPEGSGTVEIATRRCPRLRVVWDLKQPVRVQSSEEMEGGQAIGGCDITSDLDRDGHHPCYNSALQHFSTW